MANHSTVTEFIILGLSNVEELMSWLFIVFFLIYLTTVLGNVMIIAAILFESSLHTPMYFFLGNLSFLDMGCSTVILPKMLSNFLFGQKTISFVGCFMQMYFFQLLAGTECFLLAVMAYDRYVAICKPLSYPLIMNQKVCLALLTFSWFGSFLNSTLHTVAASQLTFCGPNGINHFFCDVPPLYKLSCSDTSLNEKVLFTAGVFVGVGPCLFITLSYVIIISAILKITSTEKRIKAFSTCASHLTVVVLFYGTGTFSYIRSLPGFSFDKGKVIPLLYSTVTPMLNPLIYSLRNREVKGVLRRTLWRKVTSGPH
ncbi:olfactory receptor 3A2-like [Rhinatrema bivittatum]|uniref:olfactory receptor 3A2-like n=1 Tax=Rhinatrema bivittatum TaxID=194408 RepID=UPI00112730CB|nr:olfactory receptor 3A2-like [Rhinatrema bivittatum]